MIRILIILLLFQGLSKSTYAQPCVQQVDTAHLAYVHNGLILGDSYVLSTVLDQENGVRTMGFVTKNSMGMDSIIDTTYSFPVASSNPRLYKLNDSSFIEALEVAPNFYLGDPKRHIEINFDKRDTSSATVVINTRDRNRLRGCLLEQDSNTFHVLYQTPLEDPFLTKAYWNRYNLEGELLSSILLSDNEHFIPYTIAPCADGTYLISFLFYTYGNTVRDIGFLKVTTSGEVLWRIEEIEFGNGNDFLSLFALPDQTLLKTRRTATGYDCKKIDLNGKILRNIQLPQDLVNPVGRIWHLTDSGEVVLSYTAVDSNNYTYHPRLAKYDPFGDLVWTKSFELNPNGDEYFFSMDIAEDNGFMLAGYSEDSTRYPRGWFMKTNCLGEVSNDPVDCNLFNCTDYPIDASFTVSDTLVDLSVDNGNVYFANHSPYASSYLWNFNNGANYATRATPVQTFTENGVYEVELDVYVGNCHASSTQTVRVINALSLTERMFTGADITLYPNPSRGAVVTCSAEKAIVTGYAAYNELGVEVSNMNFGAPEQTCQMSTSSFASGVYFMHLKLLNGQTIVKKLVVE